MKRVASIVLAAVSTMVFAGARGIDTANMDLSVDPAQDFFEYVNGGWLQRTDIPKSESSWGITSELRDRNKVALHSLLDSIATINAEPGTNAQKVSDFFFTGMDSLEIEKNGISPLKKYFDEIDGCTTPEDVLRVVETQQRSGGGSLFGVFVESDFKNSDINSVYAFQGGLGLPDRDYYLDSTARFVNYRKEYRLHLQKMFGLLGSDSMAASKEAETVIGIETRLAKASWTRVRLREIATWYNPRTFEEAARETPHIDWKNYFAALGAKDLKFFVLAQPEFFHELDTMLTQVPVADWKVYLRWHFINATAPFVSSPFVNQDFHFYQTVLNGTTELKPRWKRVAEQTDGSLGEALGQLYVARYFPPEAKVRANQMVTDLRTAFAARIRKLDWMSDETKANALEKLSKLTQKIGYPDTWRDYSALHIKRDAYVLNIIRGNVFEFNRRFAEIGRPVDRGQWGLTPPTVNAYYHPLRNEVVFPAGILQPPFFDPNVDDAVNYGAIGGAIGHEITHGFDDKGSQFDADGNLRNWWNDADREKFRARTKVVEDQFNAYTVLDTVHINGKLTLGENIADLGGLAVAYDALQIALAKSGKRETIDGYTPEQRFFIAFASGWRQKRRDDAMLRLVKTDPHTPERYRTIGPLSNMPEFFAAFHVKEGDAMRRPDSLIAKIW